MEPQDFEELEVQRIELEAERMRLMVEVIHAAKRAIAEVRSQSVNVRDGSRLAGKSWVNLRTAMDHLGITRSGVDKAVKRGKLTAKGTRQNRRYSTESLLKYRPPE
jgi:hypothetical protein